jgi:ATP-dependent exoDNAse (exonuclease V) alpha subunit
MIGKDIWRILAHLHYLTDIPFLLVGDDKQLPPVEDCDMDYFNHPEVKNIINNNLIKLTEIQRYDMKLKKMSNNVMTLKTKDYPSRVADKNICYTNKTRLLVNEYLNNHKIKSINETDRVYIDNKIIIDDKKIKKSFNKDDKPKEDPTQPFWLYNGLPMIARITKGDDHVNNEEFVVMEFNDKEVMLMSERPDGKHIISIKKSHLVHRFLVAYCITTHKAQGSTIDEPITIWDWEKMDIKLRYTAITRAKKASQINFHSI